MSKCRSYIACTPPSFVDPLTFQVGMVTNGQIINSIYTKLKNTVNKFANRKLQRCSDFSLPQQQQGKSLFLRVQRFPWEQDGECRVKNMMLSSDYSSCGVE